MNQTVGVVTVGRSDYGLSRPILRALQRTSGLQVRLLVAGAHLVPEFGLTVREIEADAFEIGERIEMLVPSDAPADIAQSMGRGVAGFAQAYARCRPDWLLVLGDRFEMYAAALAALPFTIPVAHVHGGELTQGAIDDALRHGITKLSHLHFVSTQVYAERVMQLGEEPWRVTVSGAPGLDNLRTTPPLNRQDLEVRVGMSLNPPPLLVTFHPVTLEHERTAWHIEELLSALEMMEWPVIFTSPNADTHGRLILNRIRMYVDTHPEARLVEHCGTSAYFGLMAMAAAMVGNSSSGIIEAPSFGLPVVNIGTRQQGRLRAENVIDVDYPRAEIVQGIRQAIDPVFRARLQGLSNPYGDGHAAEIIAATLARTPRDRRLLQKRFVDLARTPRSSARAHSAVTHVA